MNFKNYLLTFISLLLVIEIVESSNNNKNNLGFAGKGGKKLKNADKSTWAGYLLKFNSALVAYNTKKEYEIGKMIAKIISAKKSEPKIVIDNKKLPSDNQKLPSDNQKLLSDNQKLPANDNFIIKSHMDSLDIYNDILSNGWNNEKNKLKTEAYDVRNKVLSFAIKNEKIDLIKDLVNEKIIKIDTHNYEFAVETARTSKTEIADSIVDYLSTSSPHLGYQASASKKLDLGFALFPIFEAIEKNNFPLLRRALDEGLNPNTGLSGYGSLLCFSVFFRCTRCVEMLIKRNANVNAHMKMNFSIPLEATEQILNVNGWTPLMVAVGYGQERIIKALIASGVAEVSRTSLHDNILHARAVARNIKSEALRMKILDTLILSTIEFNRLSSMTKGKDLISAVIAGNYGVVDAFLLQRPNFPKIPVKIHVYPNQIAEIITNLVQREGITTTTDK